MSLVTTTATKESSPNRRTPCPYGRLAVIDACFLPRAPSDRDVPLARFSSLSGSPLVKPRSRAPAQAARIPSPRSRSRSPPLNREHLLRNVTIERVSLFHADVQEVDRILETVQGPRQLILSASARPLIGRAHEFERASIAAQVRSIPRLISSNWSCWHRGMVAECGLDPPERGDPAAEGVAGRTQRFEFGTDPADRFRPHAESPTSRREDVRPSGANCSTWLPRRSLQRAAAARPTRPRPAARRPRRVEGRTRRPSDRPGRANLRIDGKPRSEPASRPHSGRARAAMLSNAIWRARSPRSGCS